MSESTKEGGGQGSLARVIIFVALFLYPPFLEDGLKFTKTNAQCSGEERLGGPAVGGTGHPYW